MSHVLLDCILMHILLPFASNIHVPKLCPSMFDDLGHIATEIWVSTSLIKWVFMHLFFCTFYICRPLNLKIPGIHLKITKSYISGLTLVNQKGGAGVMETDIFIRKCMMNIVSCIMQRQNGMIDQELQRSYWHCLWWSWDFLSVLWLILPFRRQKFTHFCRGVWSTHKRILKLEENSREDDVLVTI